MKKLLLILLCVPLLFSCGGNNEKDNSLSLYKKNLETCKNLSKASVEYDIETIEDLLTEDFEYYSYPINQPKGVKWNKSDAINSSIFKRDLGIKYQLKHSIYLPGIDTVNLQMDGSVRVYYSALISVKGEEIEITAYETVDFKDGKISRIDHFSDISAFQISFNDIYCASEDCINGKNDTINYKDSDENLILQYIGPFKHGYFHGQGTMITADGEVYEGLWEYGKFIGKE